MTNDERLQMYAQKTEIFLDHYLNTKNCKGQSIIIDAMRYSSLTEGKRLRPILLLEFCRICGGDIDNALPFAAAIEMIHTYSLIHDDLPCMDNDDFRRGRPTSHKVYGEAYAILAGDALLTHAFELLSKNQNLQNFDAQKIVKCINTIAKNSGVFGMVGGQVLDIKSEDKDISYDELVTLQEYKTGSLICASCEIGCILADANDLKLNAAREYARTLGLAFQIRDDILDIEGDENIFGKPIGSDEENKKVTFPSKIGMSECIKKIDELTNKAIICAKNGFDDNEFIIYLAKKLSNRNK